MSAPVPASGKEGSSAERRVSTGNMLETSERRVDSPPVVIDNTASPAPVESTDEDFNRRMRNMSLGPEPLQSTQSHQIPDYHYPMQGPVFQHQPVYTPIPPTLPHFPSQQAFYEPPRQEFRLDTMHGMPGYPVPPPIARSNQSSSPSAYSVAGHHSTTPRPYGWGSPPMSPVMSSVPFGGMGSMTGLGRGDMEVLTGHARRMEGYQGMVYGAHHQGQWMTPAPSSPYTYYTPFAQTPGVPSPSSPANTPEFQHRGSWNGPQHRPSYITNANRMSWKGPTVTESQKDRERKAYHPQPPARRSDWVMWVGNVPSNTTHEELWRYFNSNAPTLPHDTNDVEWHGPSSIFLISRSSCAFVNLSNQTDLDRAVQFFNGRSLRPHDPKCPRMVCRVRKKDDDLKAGVGAQRGTGMHREWIKAQGGDISKLPQPVDTDLVPPSTESALGSAKSQEPPSPAVLERPPEGEGRRRESIVNANDAKHESTASMASTNSSFLVRHFPKRYFILKSLSTVELEDSVRYGTWKTQRHNEPILAQEVILVFSANKSGEFFGYAKMIEPIDKEKAMAKAAQAQRPVRPGSLSSGSGGSGSIPLAKTTPQTESIAEEDETGQVPQRPQWLQSQSQQRFAASSPGQLTPHDADGEGDDLEARRRTERKTESPQPVGMGSLDNQSTASAPVGNARAQTLGSDRHHGKRTVHDGEPKSFFDLPVPQASREDAADKQEALGGSSKPPNVDELGISRKDTILTPGEKAQREELHGNLAAHDQDGFAPDDWGQAFRIEWIRAGPLPFHRIRNLRNPWNADREVKVSRDGTEVEPSTAAVLLAEWDRLGYTSVLPTFPEYR